MNFLERIKHPQIIETTDEERVDHLVTANHILFDQGIVDGMGHVSVRSVKNPAHFFLSRHKAPGLVTVDDIMEFDLDSQPIDQRGRTLYGERFIHGEIYRARPDVQSIVHAHTPAIIPFGVTGVPLRPIFHMAGFLPQQTPLFEIRQVEGAGETNTLLILNNGLGAALAKSLANSSIVLMRGHGMCVVGHDVIQAVGRACYAMVNAQIVLDATRLGPATFLSSDEGLDTDGRRDWSIWQARADAHTATYLAAARKT